MKLRHTALSFAIATALFSPSAFSIGYSAVKTQSFLYEPLKVQVLLNLAPDEDYSQSSIQLATPAQFKQSGMNYPLNAGDISVRTDRRNKGGLSVLVQSNKPVYDPAIKLLFEVKNNGSSLLVPVNVLLDVPFSSSMNPLFQAQLPQNQSVNAVAPSSAASAPSSTASTSTSNTKIKAKSNLMPLLPDVAQDPSSAPKVKKKSPSVASSADADPLVPVKKKKKHEEIIESSNPKSSVNVVEKERQDKPRAIKSSNVNSDYDIRISALEQGQQRLEKGQATMEKHLIQIGDQLSKMSLKQPLQPSLPVNTNQEVQVKHSTSNTSIADPVMTNSTGTGPYNASDTPAAELNSSSPASSSAASEPDVNFNPTENRPASEPAVSHPVVKRPVVQSPALASNDKDNSFVDLILTHLPYVLAGVLTLGLGAYYMVRRRRALKEYQSSTLGADTTLSFPQEPVVDQTPSSEIKTPHRKFNPSRSTPSPLANDVSDLKQSIFSSDPDLLQSEPTGRGFFDSTRTETVLKDKDQFSSDLDFSHDLSFPESSGGDTLSFDMNTSSSHQDIDASFTKASMVAKVTASRSVDRNDLVKTFTPSDSVPDCPARLQLELACLYAQSQDWDSARVPLKEILMDQSQSVAHAEAKNLLAKIDAMM